MGLEKCFQSLPVKNKILTFDRTRKRLPSQRRRARNNDGQNFQIPKADLYVYKYYKSTTQLQKIIETDWVRNTKKEIQEKFSTSISYGYGP